MDPSGEAILNLAREAMRAAERQVPKYSHARSPRLFNQRQLFALLAIRRYLHADFRAVAGLADRSVALREVLGIERAPHYSTLCYAERRLLARGDHEALMREVLESARGTAYRPAPPVRRFPRSAQPPARRHLPPEGEGEMPGASGRSVGATPTFVGNYFPPPPGHDPPGVS
jgi:hypothetical protein